MYVGVHVKYPSFLSDFNEKINKKHSNITKIHPENPTQNGVNKQQH
jgi:hypothetical protein